MHLSCLLLGIVLLLGTDRQKEQYSENSSKSDCGEAGHLGWDSFCANPLCIYQQAKGVHPCSYCRVAGVP